MFFSRYFSIIKFIIKHPLNQNKKIRSLFRFASWQILSRFFIRKKIFKWIDQSLLIAHQGEVSITGNLYVGLLELNDMGFLLHFLKQKDVFVDVGANSGAYTVLASKVIGSKSISIEPIEKSYKRIEEHLKINKIEYLVNLQNCGIGKEEGELLFTNNNDSTNHVVYENYDKITSLCKIKTLNSLLKKNNSYVVKIDTEGFEYNVLKGADKILSKGNIAAIIIELNSSGKTYGSTNNDVHNQLLSYGYFPIYYNPFLRMIKKKQSIKFENNNVIYIKDINQAKKRCSRAKSRIIHTAHGVII
jgi:FkbM family methyltransferase